jgi:hypothetical protein
MSPLTLHRRPSRASAATPHGTFQDKVLIPGTIATRSYLFLFPFSPFSNHLSQLTIHNLICTLSDRLGYHGVATRAQAIFDSIMRRTSIKWGKAAKRAAAAAVVFAMREQGRGDRTHYVAVSTSFLSFFHFRSNWPPRPGSVLSHPGLIIYGYGCGLLWVPLRASSWAPSPYSRQVVLPSLLILGDG